MKLFSKHFNPLWLLLLILLIPIIALAFSTGNISGGYQIRKNQISIALYHNTTNNIANASYNSSPLGMCLQNYSFTKDYFVPTGTLNEWNNFLGQVGPAGADLIPVNCCGDNICSGTDTPANCMNDCPGSSLVETESVSLL
jgi:hypothetical protein